MKTLRACISFYQSFALASITITLCCAAILYTYGIRTFAVLCWFKVLTLVLIVYFIHQYKFKQFYYYKNIGISKKKLWLGVLSFDGILFIILMIVSFQLR